MAARSFVNRQGKSLIENYEDNFLYKALDWKIEHEFRWLVQSQDSSGIMISIEGAIKAVIVGSDFPEAYKPCVKDLCEQLKIHGGNITWITRFPYVYRSSIHDPTSS